MSRVAIVGAGFSGAVVAHELAKAGIASCVFDTRPHVAGNCHTARDQDTNVMLHVYGPHIFHTSNEEVWKYVQQFDEFVPFVNRVKTVYKGKVYSLPINLLTINSFFGKALSPRQAQQFIAGLGDSTIEHPQTFEEQALKFVGRELYEAFLKAIRKNSGACRRHNYLRAFLSVSRCALTMTITTTPAVTRECRAMDTATLSSACLITS